MKKDIDFKQWNELNEEDKWKWLHFINPVNLLPDWYKGYTLKEIEWDMNNVPITESIAWFPRISEMIEFLGEDFHKLHRHSDDQKWTEKKGGQWCVCLKPDKRFWSKEPVNALWKTVKYKLKYE